MAATFSLTSGFQNFLAFVTDMGAPLELECTHGRFPIKETSN
jgi:hypothetical protein